MYCCHRCEPAVQLLEPFVRRVPRGIVFDQRTNVLHEKVAYDAVFQESTQTPWQLVRVPPLGGIRDADQRNICCAGSVGRVGFKHVPRSNVVHGRFIVQVRVAHACVQGTGDGGTQQSE